MLKAISLFFGENENKMQRAIRFGIMPGNDLREHISSKWLIREVCLLKKDFKNQLRNLMTDECNKNYS